MRLADLEDRAAEGAGLGCALPFLPFLPLAATSAAGWEPPAAAVVSESVPWIALITVFLGIWRSWVSGTNMPWSLTSTRPLTGEMLNVLPSVGRAGQSPPCLVVNVTSGPNVVPLPLVATSRTW